MLRRKAGKDDRDQLRQWVDSLDPHWQGPVRTAMASRDQFSAIVQQTPPGPTRERLEGLQGTVATAVSRVAEAVWRAANASAVAAGLDAAGATAELKEARRSLEANRRAGRDTGSLEAQVGALAERHRAIQDALNLAEDATSKLGEANVRLKTLVARAATVAMRAGGGDPLDDLEAELTDVVSGLGALDDSLAEFA
jgi:hypothetical protein